MRKGDIIPRRILAWEQRVSSLLHYVLPSHPFPSPLFSLSLSPYFYTPLPSIFLSSPLPSLSLSSSFPFSLSFLPSPLPIFPLSFLPFLSLSPPFPFSPLPSFPPPPFLYLSPSFRFTLPSLSLSSPIFPFPSLFPSVFLIKNLIVWSQYKGWESTTTYNYYYLLIACLLYNSLVKILSSEWIECAVVTKNNKIIIKNQNGMTQKCWSRI